MSMNRINTNLQSLTAQSALNRINTRLGQTQEQLSTGLRINRAEDDAAGFSIASKLTSRIEGLNQAVRNVGDAKSVLDIAETGMNSIMDILVDMKAKAVQASNDTLGTEERGFIMEQLRGLGEEINSVAAATTYQGIDLLGESFAAPELVDENGNAINTSELTIGTGGTVGYEFSGDDVSSIQGTGGAVYTLQELFENEGRVALHSGGETVFNALGQAVHVELDLSQLGISFTNALGEAVDFDMAGLTGGAVVGGADLTLEALFKDAGPSLIGTAGGAYTVGSGDDEQDVYISFAGRDDLALNFQVGERAIDQLNISLSRLDATELGLANNLASLDGSDTGGFNDLIANIDRAIETLAGHFNQIGIDQTRLSIREENLDQAITSNSAARSRIQDADFAAVQSESIRLQILQQTATTALAQANMGAQNVLGFLQ